MKILKTKKNRGMRVLQGFWLKNPGWFWNSRKGDNDSTGDKPKPLSPLWQKNFSEKAMVTVPFLLVSIIILFFILSFFYLSITLVHVSVTQYLSYSASRKLFLDHGDIQGAEELAGQYAKDHYKNLREQFLKVPAWFEIKELEKGYIDYDNNNPHREPFYGFHINFTPKKILLRIPFISTQANKDPDLTVRISSFLGREPSKEECKEFNTKKYEEALSELCSKADCRPKGITAQNPYKEGGDNGC